MLQPQQAPETPAGAPEASPGPTFVNEPGAERGLEARVHYLESRLSEVVDRDMRFQTAATDRALRVIALSNEIVDLNEKLRLRDLEIAALRGRLRETEPRAGSVESSVRLGRPAAKAVARPLHARVAGVLHRHEDNAVARLLLRVGRGVRARVRSLRRGSAH